MSTLVSRWQRRHQDEGFTLVELLVVITILAILAAVVVFSVAGVNDRGQSSACKTDTSTIRTAEESYYAKNNTYGTLAQLTPSFLSNSSTLHSVVVTGTGSTATYAINVASASCGTVGNAVDGNSNL